MIKLNQKQIGVLQEMSLLGRPLNEVDIAEHDEEVTDTLFRLKVLKRLPSRPQDPDRYTIDTSGLDENSKPLFSK
jgi:hypothetical protein